MPENHVLDKLRACNRIIRYCLAVNEFVSLTEVKRYSDSGEALRFASHYEKLRQSASPDFELVNYSDRMTDVHLLLNINRKQDALQHLNEAVRQTIGRMTYMSDNLVSSNF